MKGIHNINSALRLHKTYTHNRTVLMGIKKISKFNLLSVWNFTPPLRRSTVAVADIHLYHPMRQYAGF